MYVYVYVLYIQHIIYIYIHIFILDIGQELALGQPSCLKRLK